MPTITLTEIVTAVVAMSAIIAVGAIVVRSLFQKFKHKPYWADKIRDPNEMRKAVLTLRTKIETRNNSRVIIVVNDVSERHNVKTELDRYLTLDKTFEILADIRQAESKQRIDLILHTPGGLGLAAEMIAAAIREHKGETVAHVPYFAMSGGSIIALAAQRIEMGLAASLSPCDPQIFGIPLFAYKKLVSTEHGKKRDTISDDNLLLSFVAGAIQTEFEADPTKLVDPIHLKEHPSEVVSQFMTGEHFHGSRIGFETLKDLGLSVSDKCLKEAYEIVDEELRIIRSESIRLKSREQLVGKTSTASSEHEIKRELESLLANLRR